MVLRMLSLFYALRGKKIVFKLKYFGKSDLATNILMLVNLYTLLVLGFILKIHGIHNYWDRGAVSVLFLPLLLPERQAMVMPPRGTELWLGRGGGEQALLDLSFRHATTQT